MEIFPNNMIMKNILSCEANQIIRTKTVRFHPFVFLPERMRTACDRSGANGKELHKGK